MYIWFSMMSYDNSTVYYSMNGVKKFVGLSTNTADNGHLVKEGLDDLQSLGLLRHSEVTVMEDGRYKTKKMVRDVKNEQEKLKKKVGKLKRKCKVGKNPKA